MRLGSLHVVTCALTHQSLKLLACFTQELIPFHSAHVAGSRRDIFDAPHVGAVKSTGMLPMLT